MDRGRPGMVQEQVRTRSGSTTSSPRTRSTRSAACAAAVPVRSPSCSAASSRPNAFIHAMPAYLADEDVAALKWVSGYPDNPSRSLPYISGLIVLNDAATGQPLAVLDAAEITAARTAAASGACIRRFAHAGWR